MLEQQGFMTVSSCFGRNMVLHLCCVLLHRFDRERSNEEVLFFDCFCNIASGIEVSA